MTLSIPLCSAPGICTHRQEHRVVVEVLRPRRRRPLVRSSMIRLLVLLQTFQKALFSSDSLVHFEKSDLWNHSVFADPWSVRIPCVLPSVRNTPLATGSVVYIPVIILWYSLKLWALSMESLGGEWESPGTGFMLDIKPCSLNPILLTFYTTNVLLFLRREKIGPINSAEILSGLRHFMLIGPNISLGRTVGCGGEGKRLKLDQNSLPSVLSTQTEIKWWNGAKSQHATDIYRLSSVCQNQF